MKKPLIIDDLPTVPDAECRQGYVYKDAIEVEEDSDEEDDDGLDNSDTNVDDALMLELAFDEM